MVKNTGVPFEIVEYLKTPPNQKELKKIVRGLGVEPLAIIRTKDKLFKELGLSKKDTKTAEEWLNILEQHPKLLERPVISYKKQYRMGRPPEKVLEILT